MERTKMQLAEGVAPYPVEDWETKETHPHREIEFHHIWRDLQFDPKGLRTTDGQTLHILHPGQHNHHQGPDFLQAKLHLDGLTFSGDAELHLDGQDWYNHGHAHDAAYNAVVLHVVLQKSSRPPRRQDGSTIPELCLAGRLQRKAKRQLSLKGGIGRDLPCQDWLCQRPEMSHTAWLSRLGQRRVHRKAEAFVRQLKALQGDWQQVTWQALARTLAGPVNAAPFEALAQALPFRLVRRYAARQDRFRMEALLFGVAGTLGPGPAKDEYHRALQEEWQYLARKHQLKAQPIALRFHRMRPPEFPTLRLSQLAGIALAFPGLSSLLSYEGAAAFAAASITSSPYWESHSRFGQSSAPRKRALGRGVRERLLTNSLVPLGILYREAHGLSREQEIQRGYLSVLPPENNKIIRAYKALHLRPGNALESQGLIELKKEFCDQRRCLECQVGKRILLGEKHAVAEIAT